MIMIMIMILIMMQTFSPHDRDDVIGPRCTCQLVTAALFASIPCQLKADLVTNPESRTRRATRTLLEVPIPARCVSVATSRGRKQPREGRNGFDETLDLHPSEFMLTLLPSPDSTMPARGRWRGTEDQERNRGEE